MSPDRLQILQVKREPPEAGSPSHFAYGGSLSPMYPGASPGPPPSSTPSPVPYTVYSPMPNQQFNVRLPSGGGLVDLNPALGRIFPDPVMNNLNSPGNFAAKIVSNKTDQERQNTVLDLDSQQYSLEMNLGNLDSGELARMVMLTDANLSENLSSNLTLSDDRPQDQAMTDSFTRVANNALQELVSLGNVMYPPSQPQ